jgi:hypothetical protein
MPVFHRAFGLALASTHAIPGLRAESFCLSPDIHVSLGVEHQWPASDETRTQLRYRSTEANEAAALHVWTLEDGAYFRMQYADGTQFMVDARGTRIWARWPPGATLADAATYLLGPVLGFALRLRGRTCLHASAVAVDGGAIVLVGPAGAGKSTLAAAFARTGRRVLTDDVAAVVEYAGIPHVVPGYGQLRLWPESVALLFGAPDALPRLTPAWEKRAMDLAPGASFGDAPLPLSAVYFLDDHRAQDAIHVEPIAPRDALLALSVNTYVGYLLDARMRAEEFTCLSRLASRIPIRRLVRPLAGARLADVWRAIQHDFETLPCTGSPTTAR